MKFIIEGETPAKKNSRITLPNGRTIPSKNYRTWHESALLQIEAMAISREASISYPVAISLNFIHGDLRRRDSDNGTSSILDLLVDAGILADDNWQIVRILNVYNQYDKGHARCEIMISQLTIKTEETGA
ncbi:MAG: RusA family crossover junction endodeoxyribonuclease [Acidaminococcaceae bacterium]|nr:RusA family crossover junction endodeoxyribonuclease [Acidaminococcaceae bacterium]